VDLGFKDKVVIVTGASNGIGKATATLFAQEGATVVMMARRPDVLEQARAEVAKIGKAEAVSIDVSDTEAYAAAIRDVAARHGRIDVLVNNAGSGVFCNIEHIDLDSFRGPFRLNVDAAMISMQTVIPIMEKQGGGAIVNCSSIMGARSQPGSGAYAASKAALNHLGRVAALEVAEKGIRVNTVQVGSVATEGTAGYREEYPEMAAKVVDANPLKRWGKPEEIANVIAFLASDKASFVTGALVAADGALGVAFPY
jgi:meso-butanediol dehydrogenase/(S,S)-butanediol dehydrogenase/diacetyl reductase